MSALALSMGLAGWAIHEQRQKNKLEREKLSKMGLPQNAGEDSDKQSFPEEKRLTPS
jgi:hypothetical protein